MSLVFKRRIPEPVAVMQARQEHRVDQMHAWIANYLKMHLDRHEAQTIWLAGQRIHDLAERTLFYTRACLEIEDRLNGLETASLQSIAHYKYLPVGVKEFICSPFYLNKGQEIYPELLKAAEELNNGTYVEAILDRFPAPCSSR